MPVELYHIRSLLLPGLWTISGAYHEIPGQWRDVFVQTPAAPHIWIPKLSIPESIALGVAATIVTNPEVTRRFWAGWLS